VLKNKNAICDNGFSQAVVTPIKTPTIIKFPKIKDTKIVKNAPPKYGAFFNFCV
jgi:hypothetical protein